MKIAITEIDDDVVRRFAQYRCRALAAGKPIVCRPDMSIPHAGSLVSWWNTGRWRRRHMSCQVWTFTRPKLLLDLAETASGIPARTGKQEVLIGEDVLERLDVVPAKFRASSPGPRSMLQK